MAGLFSSSEQDMLGNIIQQRQQANQALGSPYGKYGGIVQAGAQMADIGADAMFGGRTGASDPRMQQMNEIKNIFAQVSMEVGNTSSTAFYNKLAQALSSQYPEQARKAAEEARKMELQELQTKKVKEELQPEYRDFNIQVKSMEPDTLGNMREVTKSIKVTYKWDKDKKKYVPFEEGGTPASAAKPEPSKTPKSTFLTPEQIAAEDKRRAAAKAEAAAKASTYGMPTSGYVAP